jgi:TM2 domain-containing membrane protein YozV
MNCATHPDRETAAYCRVCGKPLCNECVRNVRGAIYCEGCLAATLSGAPVGASGVNTGPHTPNPAVAAALGFIPGLGAIYNGEYVKGLIHVAVFAGIISILNSVSNSASGGAGLGAFFGIGLACFYFYMPIEAYRTARMKQAAAYTAYAPAAPNAAAPGPGAPAPVPGAAPSAGFAPGPASAPGSVPPVLPMAQMPAPHPHSSMAGAVVLIALGVLILFANLGWLTRIWVGNWWPLILIGLGVWLLWKRFHEAPGPGGPRP